MRSRPPEQAFVATPLNLVEGEDYYIEGPYLVFTEKYLKARGYCCESACRHCPWGFSQSRKEQTGPHEPAADS